MSLGQNDNYLILEFQKLKDEITRLKAEVETANEIALRQAELIKYWQIEAETDHAHWVRHAEMNDLLRKAGDAMADAIYEADPEKLEAHKKFKLTEEEYNAVQLWNAAKEGKEGKPSV